MAIAKKGKSRVIGFVMDAGEMRAVELLRTAQNYRVMASGAAALPQGLINDGSLTDIPTLSEVFSRLMRENGFSGNAPVIIGIKNQNVLLRMASFPNLPEEKLRKAVMLQAQQFIPIPITELMLDFVRCDIEHKEGMPDSLNVLLVGGKKAYLNDILEMCKGAGRLVGDIDSAVLANFRAVAAIHTEPEPGEKSVAYVKPEPERKEDPDALPGSYVEPDYYSQYTQNVKEEQTGEPAKSLYMVVDIDHETTAMTIGREDTILMTRSAAHSADFLELAAGWHGSLKLPQDDLERLASFIGSDIQSSLQYYSMVDRAPISRVYITGRLKILDDIIRILSNQGDSNYVKPDLYPALTGIEKAQFSTCISLAMRGLENGRD